MVKIDEAKLQDLLTRGVEEIIDREELLRALRSGKPLRVKLGIDPTSPNIHIGRAGVLWKLRAFQELGHKVAFIIGDFTAVIGDTSDKESERPMMTATEVKKNIETYFKQASKIIDPKKAEMHYNSKWLKKLGFHEIGKMADAFGLHEFESRENISKRMKAGKRVSLRELLYPLMQGYDSVAVKADVELGGTDQRFNLLAGRTIQPLYGQKPQNILTRKLMEGTDGRKMSSSWGNVINIADEPNDMFGKVMSINDNLILKYFELATNISLSEIKEIKESLEGGKNPRDAKFRLAHEIVKLYHGEKKANGARDGFIATFQKKEIPLGIPEVRAKKDSLLRDALVGAGIIASNSEFFRLCRDGAISGVDGREKITDPGTKLVVPATLRIGKHRFVKIIIN